MEEPDTSTPDPRSPPPAPILALAELSGRLDGLRSLGQASHAVAEFVVAYGGADLAGLFQRGPNGHSARLAASSPVLLDLDSVETGLGEGPGTARLDDGEVITLADTRVDRLWPDWSSAAAERGVLSVVLLGMPPLPGRSITLQLFFHRADAFVLEGPAGTVARAVAKHAGIALRQIDRLANLAEAMATRDLIGQAQGIIMERYDLTSEQAMQFLRRSSQHSQEKVRDIAEQLVAHGAGSAARRSRPPRSGAVDDGQTDDR